MVPKPPDLELANLSGSFDASQPTIAAADNKPAPRAQIFTNVAPATVDPAPAAVAEVAAPAVTESKPEQFGSPPATQKFSNYLVGDVPPGYKASTTCANCQHFCGYEMGYGACSKFNFPASAFYTCDEFASKCCEQEDEESESETEIYTNPVEAPAPAVEAAVEPTVAAGEDFYEAAVQKFSNAELAALALEQTLQRFAKPSIYAEQYMGLRYRNLFKEQHGTLDGAYVAAQTTPD